MGTERFWKVSLCYTQLLQNIRNLQINVINIWTNFNSQLNSILSFKPSVKT